MRLISESFQLVKNITTRITMMESRSAIIGISPSEKISLMLSMSLIVRVVRVPIGVVSNWRRFRPIILLKMLTRISFTTLCPNQEVMNVKKKRITVSASSSTICKTVMA